MCDRFYGKIGLHLFLLGGKRPPSFLWVKAGTSLLPALHESFVLVIWSRILTLKQAPASFVVFKKKMWRIRCSM